MNDKKLHPSVEQILQYFMCGHLPIELRMISKPCCDLAFSMAHLLDQNPELIAGLRKLLEAKDCFVRAGLHKEKED